MSRSYYYLCAQLPLQAWGGKPPFDRDALDRLAEEHLSAEDLRLFRSFSLTPDWENFTPTGTIYDGFSVWEKALRAAIARARCAPGSDEAEAIPEAEHFGEISATVSSALSLSPAERELAVYHLRWKKLEELAFNRDFTLDFLCAYKLKNEILAKLNGRTAAAGREVFDRLVGAADAF